MNKYAKGLIGIMGCIILIAAILVYFLWTATSLYDGRLVVDLCNNTWDTIDDVLISFEKSDVIVNVPVIHPQERIILLIPSKIFSTPTNTQVFINYNNKKYTLMSEYHSVNGGKYNTNIQQASKVCLWNNQIDVYELDGIFGIIHSISIKPYSKIIDLDL